MKKQLLQLLVISSVAAFSAGVAQAQNQSGTSKDQSATAQDQLGTSTKQETTDQAGATQQSEVRLSKLMNAEIKSKSGENLGKLEDLMINPQTGQVDFAVIGRGGFLGLGEKLVPVPWQAVTVQSEKQFTLNVDKQKLQSAPTVDKKFSELQQPGYDVTIYRFYSIPMGTAETPGSTEQGQGSQTDTNTTTTK